MKPLKTLGILLIVAVLCALVVPTALADDLNRKTVVTFSGPVEVPGVGAQTLPAGTYVFKIMDSLSDRHIVQIFSEDGTHLYTTILAIPNYRLKTTDKTVINFQRAPCRTAGSYQGVVLSRASMGRGVCVFEVEGHRIGQGNQ